MRRKRKNKANLGTVIILVILGLIFLIAEYSIVLAAIILIAGIILFVKLKGKKENVEDVDFLAGVNQAKTNQPEAGKMKFPDRKNDITYHINAIKKFLADGNVELASLSYAKLIESVRQQNINENGKYEDNLKTIREEYEAFLKTHGLEYPREFLPPSQRKALKESPNGFALNSGSNFELTLYNAPEDVIRKIKKVLDSKMDFQDKEVSLCPLFLQHNVKCREIDEYVEKYKPKYFEKIEDLKKNSEEYKNASEMDKIDIEKEFFEEAVNALYEIADCNIELLFSADDINLTASDELIKEYGFESILTYVDFINNKYVDYDKVFDKAHIDRDSKKTEILLKAHLATLEEEKPINEVLKEYTLKDLNEIAVGQDFKRKDRAIEYILSNDNLKNDIGKRIASVRRFKLKRLPNVNDLSAFWASVKEQIKLIIYTYESGKRYAETIKNFKDYVKGFVVENFRGTDIVCPRSKEICGKKYSNKNPPKLPTHIGCSCYLENIIA